MPPATATSSWDFTPVIDLLYSFPTDTQGHRGAANDGPHSIHREVGGGEYSKKLDAIHNEQDGPKLGDFGTLWGFLAQSSRSDLPSVAQNELSLPLDSPIKVDPIHIKRVAQPTATGLIHDGFRIDKEAEDDVCSESPIKLKGRFRNPLQESSPGKCNEKITHNCLDPAPIISLTSNTKEKDSSRELRALQESLVPPLSTPPRASSPPKKILTKPAATPQTPKFPAVEPNGFTPVKAPCPTYSQLYPTRHKHPQSPPKSKLQIRPVVNASVTERRSNLVHKLIGKFPQQRKLLLKSDFLAPTCSAQDFTADSIHVFVDASNIMIGFHDCIKLSRNMPVSTRIPRVPLSFYNFSLVLERGRPTAKRVLVGSDRFPAIQEAERIGYETNILDRVHKSKEFTPRKKFQNGGNGYGNGNSNSNGLAGQSSGSETNAAPVREKWVEQAVDEILHLKILESVVDTEEPSTIVLATGDAAEAEYSGGFMKMVTRALQKGWTIELVSFSLNTSATYKRKEFRSQWGSKFKMIELDGYIEELLDM